MTTYLIAGRRAIKHLCNLPGYFIGDIGCHSNFEYLGKALAEALREDSSLTSLVQDTAGVVRYLIELRNYQEHPTDRRTIVDDFKMEADSSVSVPMWYLHGETPRPIAAEMRVLLDRLVKIAEALLILLVSEVLVEWVPYVWFDIKEDERDPAMPIRYRRSMPPSSARHDGLSFSIA